VKEIFGLKIEISAKQSRLDNQEQLLYIKELELQKQLESERKHFSSQLLVTQFEAKADQSNCALKLQACE